MKLASIQNSKDGVARKLRAALYYARKHRLERLKAQQEQAPPDDGGDDGSGG